MIDNKDQKFFREEAKYLTEVQQIKKKKRQKETKFNTPDYLWHSQNVRTKVLQLN